MKRLFLLGLVLSLAAVATVAWGVEPDKNGWYFTGSGVRTKSVAFVTVKVYAIRHDMKGLPPAKSKQAVIEADMDKKLTWRMLRDVDGEKIQGALKDAYAMNGYADGGKIGQFLGVFTGKELKEGTYVTIAYNSATKTTSINVSTGGNATIAGPDFMNATWKIWFGKIDQPTLSDAMIGNL